MSTTPVSFTKLMKCHHTRTAGPMSPIAAMSICDPLDPMVIVTHNAGCNAGNRLVMCRKSRRRERNCEAWPLGVALLRVGFRKFDVCRECVFQMISENRT